jgi:hypothetical protein
LGIEALSVALKIDGPTAEIRRRGWLPTCAQGAPPASTSADARPSKYVVLVIRSNLFAAALGLGRRARIRSMLTELMPFSRARQRGLWV